MDVKSEYFSVLDGDDYWTDENKLQRQIDFFDQNPEFTVCGHNFALLYEDGKIEKAYDDQKDTTNYRFVAEGLDDLLLNSPCPYMQTSSLVYRNVFANDMELKNKIFHSRYSGDLVRTLLHAAKGKSMYMKEVMSVYRIVSTGVWNHRSEIQKNLHNLSYFRYYKNHTFDKKYEEAFTEVIIRGYKEILQKIKPNKLQYLPLYLKLKLAIFIARKFKYCIA